MLQHMDGQIVTLFERLDLSFKQIPYQMMQCQEPPEVNPSCTNNTDTYLADLESQNVFPDFFVA